MNKSESPTLRELKAALENAEKAGGFRARSRKPRTQEKAEKQANE